LKNNSDPVIPRKTIIPFILVTSLFALWGFANSITDPMVQAFKKVLELSNSEAAWVQMSFYGGYFCMAIPASIFIKKYSYKSGILVGLGLYALGALLFYPAAVTEKFWFFCLGLYILTFGLAFLETTANPYILSMGSSKTAIRRLNLAQFFNPFGLLAGLLVAQQFILKNLKSDNISNFSNLDDLGKQLIRTSDLIVIRDPYVILGISVILFLILIIFTKMPVNKDDSSNLRIKQIAHRLLKNSKYKWGVLAQTFYVGAQIMCWTYIYQYAEGIGINSSMAANYQLTAFILFFLGRGIGTFMLRYVSSVKLLMTYSLISSILCIGTILINGYLGLYCLVLISFFMSIMFPTIYGLSLEGLSENESKIGAAGLVMAIVGGALLPKFQGSIIDLGGVKVNDIIILGASEVNLSFILTLICYLYLVYYCKKILL
tara:strand:- start:935 stop:2227 length:1293 start_codon:yes stop_codon:yes gene_type:complete